MSGLRKFSVEHRVEILVDLSYVQCSRLILMFDGCTCNNLKHLLFALCNKMFGIIHVSTMHHICCSLFSNGVVDGLNSPPRPWILVCQKIFFLSKNYVKKCQIWGWKSSIMEEFRSRIKFWAPIFPLLERSVGKLELPAAASVFNPWCCCFCWVFICCVSCSKQG